MDATRTVPASLVFQQPQGRFELLPAAQHVAAKLGVKLPGWGHHQGTPRPVQQRGPQASLQFLHLLAGRRLAESVHRGSPAETASLRDVPEKLETNLVHGLIIYQYC